MFSKRMKPIKNSNLKKKREIVATVHTRGLNQKNMLTKSKGFQSQTLSTNAFWQLKNFKQFEVSEISMCQNGSRNQKKTQNSRKKLFIYQIAKNENNKTNKQTKLVFLKQNNWDVLKHPQKIRNSYGFH